MTGRWRFAHYLFAIVVLLIVWPVSAQDDIAALYNQRNRMQTFKRDVSFADPPAYLPAIGGTTVTLNVVEAVNPFEAVRLRHRSYNGGLVGPVIRVQPGATLAIHLENHLPPEPESAHSGAEPGGFNTTNLHTHGLHVSPMRPADDVYLEIRPCEAFDFKFQIPKDHPPGTFWYHAHKHGSTALQLASGMAGALIVEGGLDDAPRIREAKEKILVIQQFVYRKIPGEDAIVHPDDVYSGEVPRVTAINGQVTPTLVMRPGEVQRWRLIHAGIGDPMVLKLEGIALHEIAVDGLALGTRVERDEIELQPGTRSDVLVQAPHDSKTYVLTSRVSNASRSARERIIEASDLLKLVVAGAPKVMELPRPEDLKAYAAFTDADVPSDADIVTDREIKMEHRVVAGKEVFHINGQPFDPDIVEIKPRLKTAERWKINGASGGHPFHMHVNAFAVRVPAGDGNPNQWLWRDTLFVPHGKTAEIRTWFRDFPGKTVVHCHMLDHEDRGMMRAMEILDGAAPASALALSKTQQAAPAAPDWSAVEAENGQRVGRNDLGRSNILLVFHQGISCVHCVRQLTLMTEQRAAFDKLKVEVVAICPSLPEAAQWGQIRKQAGIPFRMLVDPELDAFRRFDCVTPEGTPLHGLFLVSPNQRLLWQSIGKTAETDVHRILAQCRRALNEHAGETP